MARFSRRANPKTAGWAIIKHIWPKSIAGCPRRPFDLVESQLHLLCRDLFEAVDENRHLPLLVRRNGLTIYRLDSEGRPSSKGCVRAIENLRGWLSDLDPDLRRQFRSAAENCGREFLKSRSLIVDWAARRRSRGSRPMTKRSRISLSNCPLIQKGGARRQWFGHSQGRTMFFKAHCGEESGTLSPIPRLPEKRRKTRIPKKPVEFCDHRCVPPGRPIPTSISGDFDPFGRASDRQDREIRRWQVGRRTGKDAPQIRTERRRRSRRTRWLSRADDVA